LGQLLFKPLPIQVWTASLGLFSRWRLRRVLSYN